MIWYDNMMTGMITMVGFARRWGCPWNPPAAREPWCCWNLMEMILIFCDDGDGDDDDDDHDHDHDDDAYTGFDDYYGFPASEDDNAEFPASGDDNDGFPASGDDNDGFPASVKMIIQWWWLPSRCWW